MATDNPRSLKNLWGSSASCDSSFSWKNMFNLADPLLGCFDLLAFGKSSSSVSSSLKWQGEWNDKGHEVTWGMKWHGEWSSCKYVFYKPVIYTYIEQLIREKQHDTKLSNGCTLSVTYHSILTDLFWSITWQVFQLNLTNVGNPKTESMLSCNQLLVWGSDG